jgi:hypothetical protein
LYCWPCLYRWLEPGMYPSERVRLVITPSLVQPDSARRSCPVCKAGCSVGTIVPIYVRAVDSTVTLNGATSSVVQLDATTTTRNEKVAENDGNLIPESTNGNDNDSVFSVDDMASVIDDFDDDEIDLQPEFTTGLRQRRSYTIDSQSSLISDVPRRPLPQSPDRATTSTPPPSNVTTSSTTGFLVATNNNTAASSLPLSPALSIASHNHPQQTASLSHGILAPFVQEAMRRSSVPAIHRPEGFNNPDLYAQSMAEADPGATQFLSRLLLMLGSFVIMCLLLF